MRPFRKPVELNLWVMPNAGFNTRQVLTSLLRPFHRMYPHIRVKIWVFPWSIAWDRLMIVLKHSHWPFYPDVMQIGSTWTCTLAFLGALRELTPRIWEMDRDSFVPTLFETCYLPHTRKLYAVPWFLDLRVLYYRRDILKSLGLNAQDLETWDSFRRVCRLLVKNPRQRKGLHVLALSGREGEATLNDLAGWIWGAGGDFLTPDDREAAFHQAPAVEGLKFFFSLMNDGSIPLLGRDRFSAGNFFSGHAVFQQSGSWPIDFYFSPKSAFYQPAVGANFGVAPFPRGPGGRYTYLGGSHLAVSSTSRYVEESWALIRFLTSPEAQLAHAKAIGMLPCRQSEISQRFKNHPGVERVYQDGFTYARVLPQVPLLGALERLLIRCTSDITKTIVEKKYTLARMQERLNLAAQETNYIPSLYA